MIANGYTTIGLSPELLAMMGDDWSEPVQVRARRSRNGSLDLEFRRPAPQVVMVSDPGAAPRTERPARRDTHPVAPPVSSGKGAPRATDQ